MNDQKKDSQYKNACLWLTLGWLILFNIICWLGIFEIPKSLNEIGDFFAGLFSPIAFLWLIYGYFQNSASLQAQIKEMKDSVDEQRKAVEIQSENLSILKQQLIPKLHFYDGKAQYVALDGLNRDRIIIHFNLENLGRGELFNLRIKHKDVKHDLIKIKKIEAAGNTPVKFDLKSAIIDDELTNTKVDIYYEDLLGKDYRERYMLIIYKNLEEQLNWYTASIQPIKTKPLN